MREPKNKIRSFLLGVIIPFITVSVIVGIALLVYIGVDKVSGDKTVVWLVMLLTIFMLSMCFTVCDIIRRKGNIKGNRKDSIW